jgi:hypothetical protein
MEKISLSPSSEDDLIKKLSVPYMIVLPVGIVLFYRPIWGLSETLFFLLAGTYLLIAAEVAKKGEAG